jgi:hypothetical protein
MPRKTKPVPARPREYEPVVASARKAAGRAEAIAANIGGDLYTCQLRLGEIGRRALLDSRPQEEIDAEWAALAAEALAGLSAKADRLRDAIAAAQAEVAKVREAKVPATAALAAGKEAGNGG